jgi:diguanylate cyclase (GGDEF)-like protein
MTIFIVESDKTDQSWLRDVLQKNSYSSIFVAESIALATEFLGLQPTSSADHVVRLDIELFIINPGIGSENGFDLCRLIKNSFQYEDIPIIVTASGRLPGELQMAFAFGATDYLTKPLRETEVLSRIRSALKLKHEVDRRRSREKELLEVTKQLTDLNSVLARHSLADGLLGCANRRCFDTTLEQEWRRGFRSSLPLSLMLIDIDYFKQFNDTYGHQAGDDCLISVINGIRPIIKRPSDLLARYGGEEFAMLLPETTSEGAITVAERVRACVEELNIPHQASKVSDRVTVSIGTTTVVPFASGNPRRFIEEADRVLYQAKNSGRNRVCHKVTTAVDQVNAAVAAS